MKSKMIELQLTVEDFDGIDLESYAIDIAELVANGATAGKSLDEKISWTIYNKYKDEDEDF